MFYLFLGQQSCTHIKHIFNIISMHSKLMENRTDEEMGGKLRESNSQTYPCVGEFAEVWDDVESDAVYSSGQQGSSDQQNSQNDVRECRRKVHNLINTMQSLGFK